MITLTIKRLSSLLLRKPGSGLILTAITAILASLATSLNDAAMARRLKHERTFLTHLSQTVMKFPFTCCGSLAVNMCDMVRPVRVAMPAEVRREVCGEFVLKLEITDVQYLVKFGGKTFLPARKALETSFQISRLLFGNFVQQKCDVKKWIAHALRGRFQHRP